ncbi:MAG TPA: esterase-like activity of phytase family protein [Alloacidobacterium sp.]|nr:esterase-like activity of phytase family protein [Alloacidobacterium sp.]
MKRLFICAALIAIASASLHAQITLLAKGALTGSSAGSYQDLSGLKYTLENGVSANLLGGLGSGIAYAGGNTFLAVPDRGPNAVSFNSNVDDTVAYVNRFHTISMQLTPNTSGSGLPFTLTPTLRSTTLLHALLPLTYGSGVGLDIISGKPPINTLLKHYFTGRSDGYDPEHGSGDPFDARLDPESIRVSNDGLTVFVSDEYGPYVYQFLRATGERIRTYKLPADFYVANPKPTGDAEQAANNTGRVPNKGMEGLAITPDGRTLVGIVQNSLIQDAAEGGSAAKLLRIVTIDILSGRTTHQYAYLLTTGSGVSEIAALNNHEMIVDERDGKGLGDGSKAKIKQLFKIDLKGATDVSDMDGAAAAAHAVSKTLFLDVAQQLEQNGFTADQIPAKIEGVAFGPDVKLNGKTVHTLWVANDNDFLQDFSGPNTNPNQFFVFGFTDADLNGSVYVPQPHFSLSGW